MSDNAPTTPAAGITPRHVMITSVKDEGPYLIEFIAHHRVMGFAMHHFASNDCSDGTDLLLDELAGHGIITHTPNPLLPGDEPQPMAYRRIRAAHDIDQADWIMVLDADEFLQVTAGAGRVQDLTALASPDIDLISLNALCFGTNDDPDWHPGLVTRQFTRRLPPDHPRNAPLKSLTRGKGRFAGLHNHNPVNFLGGRRPVRALLGSGEVIEVAETGRMVKHFRQRDAGETSHRLAHYNHYPIKSMEGFIQRHARGRGDDTVGIKRPDRYTETYWNSFAGARIEDKTIITRYGADLDAEIARLIALPGVAEAHENSLRLYRELLDSLL